MALPSDVYLAEPQCCPKRHVSRRFSVTIPTNIKKCMWRDSTGHHFEGNMVSNLPAESLNGTKYLPSGLTRYAGVSYGYLPSGPVWCFLYHSTVSLASSSVLHSLVIFDAWMRPNARSR